MRNSVYFRCLAVLLMFFSMQNPAHAQVAEAQKLLNALGLNAGPADGVAGQNTMRAWQEFLAHRQLPLDTPLDAAGLAELRGQTDVTMPRAEGLELWLSNGRFPSKDTYRLDPEDPTAFVVTLRPGDYDPADYSQSVEVQELQHGWNLTKQRAEIKSRELKAGQTYTVDFEVKVDNVAGGTFFQIHRGGSAGGVMLGTFPDSIRLNANEAIQNMAVLRGDWYGEWQALRVVFHPSPDGASWFRIYANGQLAIDTSNINPRYPMHEASLTFGLYRGSARGVESSAWYRNIRFAEGDLGPPLTTGAP